MHVETSPYWVLSVTRAELNDSGVYECQVAAQPKIFKQFHLEVVGEWGGGGGGDKGGVAKKGMWWRVWC